MEMEMGSPQQIITKAYGATLALTKRLLTRFLMSALAFNWYLTCAPHI